MTILKTTLIIFISFLCVIPNNAEISVAMFEDLAAHVKSLEQKLNKVEEKLETAQMEIDKQKQINRIQDEEISTQNNLIDSLRTLNSELMLEVSKMERQRELAENLKSDSGEMTRENMPDKGSGHHGDQSEHKIRVVRTERENVAFSAYLNRNLSNLGPGQTIQYGATHLNEGNAFNAKTGIFTVPIDGVYLFSFACEDFHNHRIFADVVVDGSLVSLVLEGPSGTSHAMGTNVVILRLTRGQSVWVAINGGGNDNILQSTATTFSGVFLYY